MTDLLIHSMAEFADLILRTLDLTQARTIAEIGAEYGSMSHQLANHCQTHNGTLIAIDPAPAPEFLTWAATQPHVRHIASPSLEVIADLENIDAWLIDGDHNYYTVLHELRLADTVCRRDDRPLLAIMHDVAWPWARRDLYYTPQRIPPEHRHAHSYDAGVILDSADAQRHRGFRGNGQFAVALRAGGPCNGVLTAIEDFRSEAEQDAGQVGRQLLYAHVPAVFGLGVLFDAAAPWAQQLAEALVPWHDNPLLAKLETNRLRNYLAVLDWQDGFRR